LQFDFPDPQLPNAVRFLSAPPPRLPDYIEGLWEVQDIASQHLTRLVGARPGDRVMDFCRSCLCCRCSLGEGAGAGGKALGIAAALQNKGTLAVHDVRPLVLDTARSRLVRAGATTATFYFPGMCRCFFHAVADLMRQTCAARCCWPSNAAASTGSC
jgi:16S rRNA (cytosine967-C5)-methyltransferase